MFRFIVFATGLLIPFAPCGVWAADYSPLADFRVSDASGEYYVVWNRLGGPRYFEDWGATEFTIARRAGGSPPVEPAKAMIIANLDLYDVQRGSRYYEMLDATGVRVRAGDTILGRGAFRIPPRAVLVSARGHGFVALDLYGPNLPMVVDGRGGHAVVIVSAGGKVRHALKLGDLFTGEEIARFPRSADSISWLRGGWLNEERLELVLGGGCLEPDRAGRRGFGPGASRTAVSRRPIRAGQSRREPGADWRACETGGGQPAKIPLGRQPGGPSRRGRVGKIGVATPKVIRYLAASLQHEDRLARRAAAESLGQLGPAAVAAVPALIERLADPDWHVPHLGAEALGRIGPAARRAIPDLMNVVEDSARETELRIAAIGALGRMGPDGHMAISVLVKALADPCPEVAREAMLSLAAFGPAAVRPLIAALDNTDGYADCNAAEALGLIGPHAAAATGALIQTVAQVESATGYHAQAPLLAIGPAAVPGLAEALTDEDEDVRATAARILGLLGPKAESAAAALSAATADPDEYVRFHAELAMKRIGE